MGQISKASLETKSAKLKALVALMMDDDISDELIQIEGVGSAFMSELAQGVSECAKANDAAIATIKW